MMVHHNTPQVFLHVAPKHSTTQELFFSFQSSKKWFCVAECASNVGYAPQWQKPFFENEPMVELCTLCNLIPGDSRLFCSTCATYFEHFMLMSILQSDTQRKKRGKTSASQLMWCTSEGRKSLVLTEAVLLCAGTLHNFIQHP